ncbi:glutathione peroxidase [Tuwongella immobilis]|uniref:Glutathione peroxidase n=1 Tax=Tuwongella immobilis TaxID=692036 RepID=A0A6C2YU20_9BACT|nr:glutathione peroxidase [Tuwongella immobilis]VIP04529.1 glutathione peroxidase : Glutathione peroxidase OS=Solibacter usitatus (strain Ellin6076) GN=Acid_7250 PE=3 SV=1: GSHPx [Tuwongella immobilis]VTS06419.1 glutathione peroxidase : Glutathione peroxidase OS=Solibacter usitatus (strain Ellin6076) GN=Acid_7250 PE=3 SV=1: GSHPx [Tuwongella immobilis]
MTRFLSLSVMTLAIAVGSLIAVEKESKPVSSPLDFTVKSIDGKQLDLSEYKGKVVLFVNVASRCGYTPQYEGLQKLYETYSKDGLVVIGVPANEFGAQEPGSDEEIAKFCKANYSVTFPMLSKIVVKGQGIAPLYDFLTSKDSNPNFAGPIGWNFEKFLINRKGEVVGRFKSGVAPDSDKLIEAIKKELAAK